MFPLGRVSFPGTMLPLHIFELRYRQMIEDLLRSAAAEGHQPEFGVTLIERGSEVGGGDQRTRVGTLARLVQVARTPDGRYAVIAQVVARLSVDRWLPDAPYPLAEVSDWPDEPDEPHARPSLAEVAARVRRTRALASELGDPLEPVEVSETCDFDDADGEPSLVSFVLSASSPLGDADRQDLLAVPGPWARLAHLDELLVETERVLRFRLGG